MRHPIATDIKLRQKHRTLEIAFDDGQRFELSCEYLRVFSPAADRKVSDALGEPTAGKEKVNITKILPMGNYAVRLYFDDGHDTGVYSWETLYALGRNRERNWAQYLQALERAELDRPRLWDTPEEEWVEVRLLYFAALADELARTSEDVTPPNGVVTVDALLAWLRERGPPWESALHPERVTVTINRKFATLNARLCMGDEVAITPIAKGDRPVG